MHVLRRVNITCAISLINPLKQSLRRSYVARPVLSLSKQFRSYHNKVHSKSLSLSSTMAASSWSMGPGTLEVPLSLFATNRRRLAEQLKAGQVVVLQGGDDISHYDTDVQYVFRQVSVHLVFSFSVLYRLAIHPHSLSCSCFLLLTVSK